MKALDLWGFRTEVDKSATKDWYIHSEAWSCDCGHCRNFMKLARERELPIQVMEVLDRLDIPPEKATYVCEIFPDGDGFCYQFSYRLAGRILEKGENTAQTWGEARCCHEPYPYGAPGFPAPHFDLEFWVTLPWVLEEKQNG